MKYYMVWAPELGWDCIVGLYKAKNEEEVWEEFSSNTGDTVKKLKKENYYLVREYTPEIIKGK